MIFYYAFIDENNCVARLGSGYTIPEGAVSVAPEIFDHLPNMMLVGGDWVQRPTLPNHTFDEGIFTQSVPASSYAMVSDYETRADFGRVEEVDGKITFNLEDSGNYFVEIYPTGPDLKKELILNVD